MNMKTRAIVITVLGAFSVCAFAADLTPVGAERAGNSDGTIPVFDGKDAPSAGWEPGKYRGDYWAHKSEKPLFVIDASNVDKYADKLSPGQVELIKTKKGYTMPVYPAHRNCGFPDFVLENTKAGAGKASIASDGWSLQNAALPSVPFPQPASGIQAMWNWLVRYQGVGQDWPAGHTVISASPGSSNRIEFSWTQLIYFPWAKKGVSSPSDFGGLAYAIYYSYTEPAAFAGQGLIQRYYYSKDPDAYYYFTGQRRVRRLPSYAYDAPTLGTENQYPTDSQFIFYGNPDRFDWKIVGKREMYIPYNNFAVQDFRQKLDDAAGETFINPNVRRYELHRVWEIVGTVKSGVRHTAPKKVLYFDEDSWNIVVGDDYDAQGKLWKTKENYVVPTWELNGACTVPAFAMYDIKNGRYVADQLVWGTGKDQRHFEAPTDKRLNDDFFTSQSLQSMSER
ncbi:MULTISPECIES: DUF1329 domain-containing protein [Paraburkholderia]|uniref:DUF1329 domain-containing protein n=1 Tax=Paraburkholderia TaxID=1822464 RepID=UPI00224C7DFD|nr:MULTISPECIES: DUF1329 domain-containing protein [Paraburkholderia]MCX4176981.1 DUF1329 domain-containing protein [Paraburkholderia madseniana]MDQ6464971.1 DUF1329 domain-containing protein [Paraburkholderia madseniana]